MEEHGEDLSFEEAMDQRLQTIDAQVQILNEQVAAVDREMQVLAAQVRVLREAVAAARRSEAGQEDESA